MRRTYSRLASVEERKNVKKAILFVLLAVVCAVLLFFYGIPLLGRFAAFVSELGKSNKAATIVDQTPPAPPKFNSLPDYTNQTTVNLTGTTEPGANIKLTFNGSEQEGLADKDGNFSFQLNLKDGANAYSAVATDASGNVSQVSAERTITFDNKPPDLNIDSPSDNSQFFGSNQRQTTIKGTTESSAQITINDRLVIVDDNGNFQYTTTLNEGSNQFSVKATDQAGNTTQKDITLNFSP